MRKKRLKSVAVYEESFRYNGNFLNEKNGKFSSSSLSHSLFLWVCIPEERFFLFHFKVLVFHFLVFDFSFFD